MRRAAALAALILASPAAAQDRGYCPSRPGLGTTPCTIAAGKLSLETGIADWERDDRADARTDTITLAASEVRLGVSDTSEVLVVWAPFARERVREAGSVRRREGIGDVTLGFKQNLARPDGGGFSWAVQPIVSLPVGRVGGGDWETGLLVPMSYDLSESINLQVTPEIDAAANEDGRGRHLSYGTIAGVQIKLGGTVDAIAEIEVRANDDPARHERLASAALSIAWAPAADLQLDIGGVAGLSRDTPDARIYAGVSRRF